MAMGKVNHEPTPEGANRAVDDLGELWTRVRGQVPVDFQVRGAAIEVESDVHSQWRRHRSPTPKCRGHCLTTLVTIPTHPDLM